MQIIPTTEPFFFQGGRTGVLLLHGFTGTPKEVRWMGEDLQKHGYTVLGIRLHGHATHPDESHVHEAESLKLYIHVFVNLHPSSGLLLVCQ